MALGNRQRPTYVSITKGKFTVWDPDTKTNSEYEEVSGRLVDITFATRPQTAKQKFPNHEEISLTLKDGGEDYKVSCTAKTAAGQSIMKQLPSIDPNQDLVLQLSFDEEFGSTTVFIKQNDVPTQWFWSQKAGMKDLPELEKYTDPADGKEKTNSNARVAYLKEYTLGHVKPLLSTPEPAQESHAETVPDFESDDAPF